MQKRKVAALLLAVFMVLSSISFTAGAATANDNVYRGHYSMKVYTDGNSNDQQVKYVNVKPDTDYVVTYWAKGGGHKRFVVHESDPSKWNWGPTLTYDEFYGDDWSQHTLNFNTGTNTLLAVEISANQWGGAGAGYIDDIVIAEKDNPSTTVLTDDFESGKAWADNDFFSIEYSEVPQRTLPDTFSVIESSFKKGTRVATAFSPDDVVTGSAKLYNGTNAEERAIYVLAVYSGNLLSGLFIDMPEDGTVGVGEYETLSATVDLSDYPGADTIKAFVWDGPDTQEPITKEETLEQGEQKDYVFGILQSKQQNFKTNLDAGMNTVLFELSWNGFYSADGVKNTSYINEKKALLYDMYDKGYEVMLGLGTQYSPSWIYNYPNSRYKNQYGDEYNTTEIGDTAVNAVFNSAIRDKLEEYVDDVFEEFGTDFSIVRLGWMRYGEIGFPNQNYNGKTNSWWAFDDIAQGKAQGLPEGIPVCPVPGWIPGTASENNADARAFAEWYMNALLNYQNWQVDIVSKKVDSRLAILYPSWGMREGQLENAIKGNLAGTTGPEKNGEVQRGFDFARLITGITNPKAIVYCTWIDANPEWTNGDDQEVPTTSNNFSPVHYMAYYAKIHPLKLSVMGENTGGGGMNALNLTFERMKKYELDGIMWAFEPDLYDGSAPVLSDYAAAIANFVAAMAEK